MCRNGAGTEPVSCPIRCRRTMRGTTTVISASFAVAAGATVRSKPLVPIGKTTTLTAATTSWAFVWLVARENCMSVYCPRIDKEVNSWATSLPRGKLAAADRMSAVLHSIEFLIRKTRSSQMYKDVHL